MRLFVYLLRGISCINAIGREMIAVQHEDKVEVTFKIGESRNFDFVFGADGAHSAVRKLAFGDEENYSKFFGEYFAIVEAPNIKPNKPN